MNKIEEARLELLECIGHLNTAEDSFREAIHHFNLAGRPDLAARAKASMDQAVARKRRTLALIDALPTYFPKELH